MASACHFVLVISVKGDTFLACIRVTRSTEIRSNIHRKKNDGKKETARKKSTKVEKTLESSRKNGGKKKQTKPMTSVPGRRKG